MLSPEAFIHKIKPACDKFLESSTENNLEALRHELEQLDDFTLDRLQSYILLPLVLKMDKFNDDRSTEIKTKLINTLENFIGRIKLKELSALKTILLVSLKQIYNFQTGQVNFSQSEEMKMAIMQCMGTTLKRSLPDIMESFYAKPNAGFIGQISVACVQLIAKEKYRLLRVAAIECLMSLFYVHDSADFSDIIVRDKVAGTVFVFLPKIVQTLILAANGDEKQGQQLTMVSIKSLGRILSLIFEDYTRNQNSSDIETKDFIELVKHANTSKTSDDEILGNNIKSQPTAERFKTLQNFERNDAWLGASARKLIPILKTMTKLRAHSASGVRKEYAKMCRNLIENCSVYLNPSVFIETIFALSQDEDEQIRTICTDFLAKSNQTPKLQSILADNVGNLMEIHLIALPRIINRWEDAEQLSEFLFLKGIIENSPDECLATILCVPNNLEKFCMCLIAALELELSNELLKEEYALRNLNESTYTKLCWRKYQNIQNERIQKLIQSICELLGKTKTVDLIFDHLMEILVKDSPVCNEVILILIMILNGTSEEIGCRNICAVLDEILDERRWGLELQANRMNQLAVEGKTNWYVDRTPGLYESAIEIRTRDIKLDDDDDDDIDESSVNLNEAEFNVLHTCLILDAIGNFAMILGVKFQPFMFKVLHRVLQKAGSSNCVVHQAGMFALLSIQKALKFESIADLIREYSDYISYHVNISLKRMDKSKPAFDILSVVLQNSSFHSIAYLENIINTILEESSRHGQMGNIESFLKVFHMFLLGVEKWAADTTPSVLPCEQTEVKESQTDLYDSWIEILNKPEDIIRIDEESDTNLESEEPQCQEDETQEDESQPKTVLPRHIEIVVKILKEVLKFVPSKNQMHTIISLECLITGLPILRDYENELLPIVHLIWYPFAERFKENDVIVLNRCFTLLEVLAVHAKDFLLHRALKDIFPFLNKFLDKSAKHSEKTTCIIQTQEFKLQSKLLREYPNLVESMEVLDREFDRISESVLPYLNRKQPKALQELAVEYFRRMLCYNCPAVYIKLIGHEMDSGMDGNIAALLESINSGMYSNFVFR